MRRAIIDLGTNTFNLLIADIALDKFKVVHSEKVGVAIGMGGINQGRITDDSMERAIDALIDFHATCQKLKVNSIRAFGTSAIRSAENNQTFIEKVKIATGIEITVISGLEEAKMIYDGVCWSYQFNETAVIIDIGGGSTEFIWADKSGIQNAISLDIGVSRMYQALNHEDPLTDENIDEIETWLEMQSQGKLDNQFCPILIGASGSFETFYKMHYLKEFPEGIEALQMDKDDLEKSLHQIINSTLTEREQNSLIIPIRKKMAPIAAVKTRWVMKKLNTQEIWISPCALKEGALRI